MTILDPNSDSVLSLNIQQVVAIAGSGSITDISDGSPSSQQLREFLKLVRAENLFDYAHQCRDLTDYGCVFQDIVNELGRRLEFDVENGLYKGKPGAIGFDGIWRSSGEPALVVEVKTTLTYAVRLEVPNKYKQDLAVQGRISQSSSILIVVGRVKEEGALRALEAQIKGSEFSRNIRLIGVEGLIKLVEINNKADDPDTKTKQIRKLLHPVEYIRLGNLIDLIFSAIDAREEETSGPEQADDSDPRTRVDRTPIDDKRQQAIDAFSMLKRHKLIQRSRTFFWTADKDLRVCCTVSKRYENDAQRYFYAYHPKWDDFLKEGQGFLILCCLDRDDAFAIPRSWFQDNKQNLQVAEKANGIKWLIWITALADGSLAIDLKDGTKYSLEPHKFNFQHVKSRGAMR
jgi:hypothetical protein